MSHSSALVLFSGGQDSTVCLAWALAKFEHVETIGFDYGQRHVVELEQRQVIRDRITEGGPRWAGTLGTDTMLDLAVLGQISETALTREQDITLSASGLPSTFVPGRNLMFLTLSAAIAYRRNLDRLVGGMCETDYSGYPDCRRSTLNALSTALTLGLERTTPIDTPLMQLDKAQTWALAHELGGDWLVDLIVEDAHTCYLGDRSKRHDWGYGCGECPACELRAAGWRTWREGVSP